MTPVTIASGGQSSYYSSGTFGWSARSSFAYYGVAAQPTSNTDVYFGHDTTSWRQAQSFAPGSTCDVTRVRLQIGQYGSPADNLYVEIQSDSGSNKPSNTVLGTSGNVSGALATTSDAWLSFDFATAVTLTASTKYWIVLGRTGSADGGKAYQLRYNSTSQIASAGQSVGNSSNVWSAEATGDLAFHVMQAAPVAIYHLTQDTGGSPKLHMWRSTDSGATWTEQDSGNAPAVSNGTYAFDAAIAAGGSRVVIATMSSASNVDARAFDMASNLWVAKIGATAYTSSYFQRPTRITGELGTGDYGPIAIITPYSGDLSDLELSRRASSSWANSVFLAATSAGRSLISDVVIDSTGYGNQYRFYYDDQTNKFRVNSYNGGSASTAVDVDATAATSETKYAGATYEVYTISGVEYVIAAYINSDDTIHERIATLGTASASMSLASESTVSSATTSAGRSLSTCRYDGKNYIFAAVSGTGIDYYESSTAGTWTGPTSLVSGLTNCTLSQALSITGVGVAVFYTDNGDDKVELFTGVSGPTNVDETDTISPALTESATLAAALPDTETITPTLTEADSLTVAAASTDTVSPTLSEANTVATSLPDTDTVSPTLSEASTVAVPVAETDTLSPTLSEMDALAAAIADTETLAPTLSESDAITISLSDTDSIAPMLSEASSVTLSMAETDTITASLSESDSVAATAADTDTVTATLSEADTVTSVLADTDTISPTLSESDTLTVALTDTDGLTPTLTEASSVAVTLSDTDTITGSLTESDTAAAALADTNTIAPTLAEAESITVSLSLDDTDTITPTLAESETLAVAAVSTDTIAPTLSEAESVVISISDTDILTVSLGEAESITVALSEIDSIAPMLGETDTVAVAMAETDTVSPTLTEADALGALLADVDDFLMTLSEAETIDITAVIVPEADATFAAPDQRAAFTASGPTDTFAAPELAGSFTGD